MCKFSCVYLLYTVLLHKDIVTWLQSVFLMLTDPHSCKHLHIHSCTPHIHMQEKTKFSNPRIHLDERVRKIMSLKVVWIT